MLDALVLADQPGAGDRLVVAARMRRAVMLSPSNCSPRPQPAERLGLQPAVGQLLDAVGEPVLEEAAVEGGGSRVEERAPLLPQLGHRHGLQRGDASR